MLLIAQMVIVIKGKLLFPFVGVILSRRIAMMLVKVWTGWPLTFKDLATSARPLRAVTVVAHPEPRFGGVAMDRHRGETEAAISCFANCQHASWCL